MAVDILTPQVSNALGAERRLVAVIEVELQIHGTRAATIRVQDGEAEMTGRVELFDTRIPILDRRSGDQVRFADDPEIWARNLDTIFRNPHLSAHIVQDTDPNPPRERAGHSPLSFSLPPTDPAWDGLRAGPIDGLASQLASRGAERIGPLTIVSEPADPEWRP